MLHTFLTSVMDGGQWSASRSDLNPEKITLGSCWVGGWVSPTSGGRLIVKWIINIYGMNMWTDSFGSR
jgi:hypothetical protein